MSRPGPLGWSLEHHWVARPDADADADADQGALRRRIGVSVFAQTHLGEIVALELPDAGARVVAGEVYGQVESTITVADLFAPVTGTVVARNTALTGSPELVNADPEGDGWLLEVDVDEAERPGDLLDADAYRRATQGRGESGARRAGDDRAGDA